MIASFMRAVCRKDTVCEVFSKSPAKCFLLIAQPWILLFKETSTKGSTWILASPCAILSLALCLIYRVELIFTENISRELFFKIRCVSIFALLEGNSMLCMSQY